MTTVTPLALEVVLTVQTELEARPDEADTLRRGRARDPPHDSTATCVDRISRTHPKGPNLARFRGHRKESLRRALPKAHSEVSTGPLPSKTSTTGPEARYLGLDGVAFANGH